MTHLSKLIPSLVVLIFTAITAQAGTWSVGLGAAVEPSPFVGTSGYEVRPIPFVSYEGEKFDFTVGEASYELWGGDHWYLDLDASIRFEGFAPEDSPDLAGLEERDPTLDMGFSIGLESALGNFELGFKADVAGVYEGQEATFSWSVPLGNDRFIVIPGVGVTWKSEELVDYYYGVRPQEADPRFPEYHGESATNPFVNLTAVAMVTQRVWFLLDLSVEDLDDSIANSPLVDLDYQVSGMVGILYRFGDSGQPKWGRKR